MPASPAGAFAGVPMTEGNTDSDEESIGTSDGSDSDATGGGGIIRRGSDLAPMVGGVGSRNNSMLRAKPIKKLPAASPDDELSPSDEKEARQEMEKAGSTGSANLHQLHLGLNVNLIKQLLTTGAGLANIRELVLSENAIESLQHSVFDRVPNLVKLDLTNNKLTVIPLSAMSLRNLTTLLLDHNNITSVPATYDLVEPLELPSLTTIGLEWNKLTEFPSHLHEIAPKLRKIYMCENLGIQNLPPVDCFPVAASPEERVEVRLDNRPTLMDQYARGGYDARVTVNWNKIYPDKVMDYVYLGSLRTAQCKEVYRDLDIKYVLTAGRNLEVYLPEGMKQLLLPLDDVPGENISVFFSDAFKFIDDAIAEQKGVLLHCFAGLSRSVTVMVAYMMKRCYPMTMQEALARVRQARPNSHPNDGFIKSLEKFEVDLKAELGNAAAA